MATIRYGSTASGALKWTDPQTIATSQFPLKGQALPPKPPAPTPPPIPVPPTPEPVMQLPALVYQIAADFADEIPPPQRGQHETTGQHEERCRQWSIRLAQQVHYDTQEARWGVKRSSPTNPISKDSLAFNGADGLHAWDMLIGTGTGKPIFATNPAHHFIPTQKFEPVEPVNHLGTTPTPPPPAPTPLPPAPPPVSYGVFVGVEASDVAAKYQAVHGRPPAASDLAHNAWRRLVEGWSHQAILEDIK
jgi:hypothetical protein